MAELFLSFFAYSVVGWVSEVVYCSLQERRLVNRGFLRGPWCPVYGFGGVLVVALLSPLAESIVALFLAAALLTTVVEYATGWLLETLFQTRWWDYSRYRLNIKGRVCLVNSVLFGIMGALGVSVLAPLLDRAIALIPDSLVNPFALALYTLMMLDLAVTLREIVRLDEKLSRLADFVESLRERLDVADWFNERDLAASFESLRERARADMDGLHDRLARRLDSLLAHTGSTRRLLRAFPGLRSARYARSLDLLRGSLRARRKDPGRVAGRAAGRD